MDLDNNKANIVQMTPPVGKVTVVDVCGVLARIQDRKLIKDEPKDQDIFKAEVASLIRRVRSSDGVRFQCVVCEKTLKMKAHVSSHIEANHVRGVSHQCAHCSGLFKTRNTLQSHKSKMKFLGYMFQADYLQ